MGSNFSEEFQVAILLASFGDESTSTYGPVFASLHMTESEPTRESVTSRLLQEFEEKNWALQREARRCQQKSIALAAIEFNLQGWCHNMDPSGSVLVRRGKVVLGSSKLQHHQPLSRVADMTPVNGRIELRPQKGEGSLGVHFLQAVERPIWGACASSLQGVTHPGRSRLLSSLGSGQRGRCPVYSGGVRPRPLSTSTSGGRAVQ